MHQKSVRHPKAIITVVTNHYFHQAVILGNSIKQFEKETDFIIFVVGYSPEEPCYQGCEFEIVDAKILNPEEWERFLFQYTNVAACCALKPMALKHTLLHYKKAIYLDSDIKLFNELSKGWHELDDAELSLTPHRNGAPQITAGMISPQMLRLAGVFNAGYVGATPSVTYFLDWWWQKTNYNCLLDDYIMGIYLDQLYLHDAVGRVNRLSVLKHCGYNVAWWNFDQKKIEHHYDRYFINGVPLICFHFSSFRFFLKDPTNTEWLKTRLGNIYFKLFTNYISELAHYKNRLNIQSYSYNHFKDGTFITRDWREYMRRDIPELKEVTHPFDLSADERKKIEDVMKTRPEFFRPNKTREVNDWRSSDLVYTYALSKTHSYIQFLEKIIRDNGLATPKE